MNEFVLHIWITDKTGRIQSYTVKGATWKAFVANLGIALLKPRFICCLMQGKVGLIFTKPGMDHPEAPPAANAQHFMERCACFDLSDREKEVAALMLKGYNDKRMVDALHISYPTVNSHVQNIYGKMNVHSRSEFLTKWREDPMQVPVPVECVILFAGYFLQDSFAFLVQL